MTTVNSFKRENSPRSGDYMGVGSEGVKRSCEACGPHCSVKICITGAYFLFHYRVLDQSEDFAHAL